MHGKLPNVSRQRCLGEGQQLQVLLTMARIQMFLGLHSLIVIQESGIPFCEFLGTFTKEFKGQLRRKTGSRGTILFERKTKGHANCKRRQLPWGGRRQPSKLGVELTQKADVERGTSENSEKTQGFGESMLRLWASIQKQEKQEKET